MKTVEPARVRSLVDAAARAGFEHRGSAAWLEVNGGVVEHAFLVPLRDAPEQANSLQCALVLLSDRNHCGWMRLSVTFEDYRRLHRCKQEDLNLIALNLAVRGTLLTSHTDRLAK